MASSDTLPRGLCIHCDALVYPGKNCVIIFRVGGRGAEWAHMGCTLRAIDDKHQETATKRERRIVVSMFIAIALFLLALVLVGPLGETTEIAWATSTFNPWAGCTKVSPGCTNCYAEADTRRYGFVGWGAGEPRRRTSPANWRKPLAWNIKEVATNYECGIVLDGFDSLQEGDRLEVKA